MNLTPSHKNLRYTSSFLYTKEMLIVVAVVIFPMIFPETAHASLLSFLSSLIGENVSAQETMATSTSYNSQTLPLLKAAVNIQPMPTSTDALAIADNTLVPSVGPSGSIADIDNQPGSTAISTYVVRPGDTLSEIAAMFDVSVNTIVWANDLGTKPVIQPGETLAILPVSGINYTVKKGDTLASIVKKYGGDVTEVMEYNGLSTGASIAIGDTIMIPDGELGGPSASINTQTHTSSGIKYNPLILADGGPAIPGYYACPVHGSWLSQGLHGHNAVDLAIGIGNSIDAAANGTVIIAKSNSAWNGGYGNYVVISHPNGTETLYAHAKKIFVTTGEKVTQGEKIAEIGVTGETTGPHIHFEVRGAANPFVTVKC
jgi:LysM repeat protein